MRLRLDPKFRKELIILAALRVAERPGGWANLTRDTVAAEAGCATGTVSLHFNTMKQFRRAIMRAAIAKKNLNVLGQGLAMRDECALKADKALREAAIREAMS